MTGRRYLIRRSGGGSRTVLLSGITVRGSLLVGEQETDPQEGKRLRRRLEDLERRAGSTPAEVRHENQPGNDSQHYENIPGARQPHPSPKLPANQFTPPMQSDDTRIFTNRFEQEGSPASSPSAQDTYPAPKDVLCPRCSQSVGPISSSGGWTREEPNYLASAPLTLPSMMQIDNLVNREYEDTIDVLRHDLPATAGGRYSHNVTNHSDSNIYALPEHCACHPNVGDWQSASLRMCTVYISTRNTFRYKYCTSVLAACYDTSQSG